MAVGSWVSAQTIACVGCSRGGERSLATIRQETPDDISVKLGYYNTCEIALRATESLTRIIDALVDNMKSAGN